MREPGVKAFVVSNKRLLLILRDNKPSIAFPNTWNLPGGGIDGGELPKKAIKRELKEGLNIVPRSIKYLGQQKYSDGSIVYRYLIKLEAGEVDKLKLGSEGQRFEFFTIPEIQNIQLSGYLDEYFSMYTTQIKKLLAGEDLTPEELGLAS